MRRTFAILLLAILLPCSFTLAQDGSNVGSQFNQFINANDRFARKLLQVVNEAVPDKNIVLSPVPLSLAFAPLTDASATMSGEASDEIENAFEWANVSGLNLSARMLLSRFDGKDLTFFSTFYYRGPDNLSEGFIVRGTKYFGLHFRRLAPQAQGQQILRQLWGSGATFPNAPLHNDDFWIVSSNQLKTLWEGNTFSLGTRKKDSFFLASGQKKQVSMIESVAGMYGHAKNSDFEAVALRCFDAYLVVVLPSPDKDISQLEAGLADGTISLDSQLKPEMGQVELPEFSFQFESDLRPSLERLGVHEVFSKADALFPMAKNGALLRGVSQRTSIEVNREGIRANAGTIVNGVYGGVCGNCETPFRMVVNRPFLFFIRDNQTDALLFIGAVSDPSK